MSDIIVVFLGAWLWVCISAMLMAYAPPISVIMWFIGQAVACLAVLIYEETR